MSNRNIIVSIVIFFIALKTSGQSPDVTNVVPPSPQAAAFARYGEIPVDYSTGVPKISIPLYVLKSGKLELPVTLSYHASGNKVNDFASCVGLGWVLNASGIISRTVFGMPDEDAVKRFRSSADISTFISSVTTDAQKLAAMTDLKGLYEGGYETQSDRYVYNFPKHVGVLRYDFITDEMMAVPYTPIKIIKHQDNSLPIPYFEIVSEDGTRNIFKDIESSVTPNGKVNRSWYLSTIISYDNADTIQFTYTTGQGYSQNNIVNSLDDWRNGNTTEYAFKTTNNYVTYSPIYLSAIDSRTTKIVLQYSNDRLDPVKTKLNSVLVYSKTTGNTLDQVRKIDLVQDYFGSAADKNLRLKLMNVVVAGKEVTGVEKYTFRYNSKPLPPYPMDDWNAPYMYFHEDYWGYYNGTNTSSLIPHEFIPQQSTDLATNFGYGGDRNPNKETMDGCMLQEIEYPTKGKTVFEFEPNIGGQNYYGYTNNNNGVVGGLRVKTIKSYADANSAPIIKTYEYPNYSTDQVVKREYYSYAPTYTTVSQAGCSDRIHFISNSISVGALTQMNGSPVIYTKVIEYTGTTTGNTGKKEFLYDYDPIQFSENVDGPRYSSVYHYDKGLCMPRLTWNYTYKNVNNIYQKVNATNYQYNFFKSHEFNTGFKIDRDRFYTNPQGYLVIPYCTMDAYLNEFIYSDTKGYENVPLLIQRDDYTYMTETDYMVKSTTYDYNNLIHLQPTSQTATTSDGDVLRTDFKYPLDFNDQEPYHTMVQKNILNPVIQQLTYKNTNAFLEYSKINYNFWYNNTWGQQNDNSLIVPQSVEYKILDKAPEIKINYYAYDDKSNVLSFSRDRNVRRSYIWGYNKAYPIAEVINAKENEVFFDGFEEPGTWDGDINNTTKAHTGRGCAFIDKPTSGELVYHSKKWLNVSLTQPTKFKYSGWVFSNGPTYEINLFMKTATETQYYTYVDAIAGSTTGKWVYLEKEFTVPANITLLNIRIDNNGGGSVWFDDIRLAPSAAEMTTYTYDPLIGITSQSDIGSVPTFYEYDSHNRLSMVRDQDRNILKKICYNYAGQAESCQ